MDASPVDLSSLPLAPIEPAPGMIPPSGVGPYREADYLALPEEPRLELIEGRYYVSPAPITLHQIVSFELSTWIAGLRRRTGGQALTAPIDLRLADHTILQPDLLYFGRERRQPLGARLTALPDLVIEILSPSTSSRDRVHKARLYAEHGVREYWIVDPAGRVFDFFVLVDGRYQLQPHDGASYESTALDGVAIDLAEFWRGVDSQIEP
ncbi:MAG: Uma2 family endonuclease [Planctomycetota bacterium]